MAAVNGKTCYISTISQKNEGLPRGSLPKLPYVPMFPHVFLFYSPFNKVAYHFSPPSIPFPKKTREEKRHQKKLIKEEIRLFVTFNLCDTSSQAFERNSQSIRVGWVSELTLIFLVNHHNTLTRRNLPSSLLVLIFSMWYLFVLGLPPHIPFLLRCMVTDSTWPIKWDC